MALLWEAPAGLGCFDNRLFGTSTGGFSDLYDAVAHLHGCHMAFLVLQLGVISGSVHTFGWGREGERGMAAPFAAG